MNVWLPWIGVWLGIIIGGGIVIGAHLLIDWWRHRDL